MSVFGAFGRQGADSESCTARGIQGSAAPNKMRRSLRRWSAVAAAASTVGAAAAAHVQAETRRCREQMDAAAASRWGDTAVAAPAPGERGGPQRQRPLVQSLRSLTDRLAAIDGALSGQPEPEPEPEVELGAQRPRRRERQRAAREGAASAVTVGSQNIMDGCLLLPLLDDFERAGIGRAVDVLCVQENVLTPRAAGPGGGSGSGSSHHAGRIALAMARHSADGNHPQAQPQPQPHAQPHRQFVCHRCEEAPRLATIYDGEKLRLVASCLIELPLLDPIPWHSRVVFKSVPERKHALVTVFAPNDVGACSATAGGGAGGNSTDLLGPPPVTSVGPLTAVAADRQPQQPQLVVVNLHLDAMGDNGHRGRQLRALASALQQQQLAIDMVACGDTNIFAMGHSPQRRALKQAVAPLTELGATLCGEASGSTDATTDIDTVMDETMLDTHFFARAYEPKLPQQLAVAAGRLGIEIPGVFDIVATTLPVVERHHWTIMSSDHDCVAATVRLRQPSQAVR